jgi:hemerythrin superfamily protein
MEASHMAISHNVIIRGYNSIHQQAHRITAKDQKDFVAYCLAWERFVRDHHRYEEMYLFPAIEEACGEKDIMEEEIEQHSQSSLLLLSLM